MMKMFFIKFWPPCPIQVCLQKQKGRVRGRVVMGVLDLSKSSLDLELFSFCASVNFFTLKKILTRLAWLGNITLLVSSEHTCGRVLWPLLSPSSPGARPELWVSRRLRRRSRAWVASWACWDPSLSWHLASWDVGILRCWLLSISWNKNKHRIKT